MINSAIRGSGHVLFRVMMTFTRRVSKNGSSDVRDFGAQWPTHVSRFWRPSWWMKSTRRIPHTIAHLAKNSPSRNSQMRVPYPVPSARKSACKSSCKKLVLFIRLLCEYEDKLWHNFPVSNFIKRHSAVMEFFHSDGQTDRYSETNRRVFATFNCESV